MAIFGGIFVWMSMTTPKGFIPDEDQNFLAVTVNLPPGASKTRTIEVIKLPSIIYQDIQL